ncbi:MAG: rRNA maturation RNase YbeY [Pseudomonadota bacterium]
MANTELRLELQHACQAIDLPSKQTIRRWIETSLQILGQLPDQQAIKAANICIRVVDEVESARLNHTYRQKSAPTNILSFAYNRDPLEGDLVICASVLQEEANAMGIDHDSHWAHIIIHGVLHLLAYDHEIDEDAEKMEALETTIMAKLGYNNPYELM